MNSKDTIMLGLGLQAPREITGQLLDTDKNSHERRLTIQDQRGTRYPCPICGTLCHAHDFKEMTWRHLNFFQHHCFITAAVPRIRCQEHGVQQIEVPWARKGSRFTLLFEQAAHDSGAGNARPDHGHDPGDDRQAAVADRGALR